MSNARLRVLAAVAGVVSSAQCLTAQLVYQETFDGGVASAGGPFTTGAPLTDLGWQQYGAKYAGYFNNSPQWINSETLSPMGVTNGVYIGQHRSMNLHYMAFFTTDTMGAGPFGPSSFSDFTFGGNLTFSIFTQLQGDTSGDTITARFMVQDGGQWYASSLSVAPPVSGNGGGNYFDPRSLTLSANATDWDMVLGLSDDGTLLLGGPAGSNLTGPVTGVGVMEGLIDPNVNSSGWNYADLQISIAPEPCSITLFCAGAALLALIRWRRNGLPSSARLTANPLLLAFE